VGGTSPFGAKKKMPVYLEESALALPRIWVNGGRRGFLVSMVPSDLVRGLGPILVNVGLEK
jgi:prolyl-tRNA editing enzyme YbaK/EbsC (Cys-tRNA(Pro) deacylase)